MESFANASILALRVFQMVVPLIITLSCSMFLISRKKNIYTKSVMALVPLLFAIRRAIDPYDTRRIIIIVSPETDVLIDRIYWGITIFLTIQVLVIFVTELLFKKD